MTSKEAREELKRIRQYQNKIAERKQRLSQLRSTMITIRTSSFDVPVVGGSPANGCRLENLIDRASKLENQIYVDIVSMEEEKQRLCVQIEKLPEPYCSVLTRRYVGLQRFEKIAVDLNYTYEWVRHLDGIGVKKFADLQ